MNDRYLFRGKRLDNGEWVQGHYVYEDDKNGICYNPHDGIKIVRWIEIDPATLGQCTGLKDKNGRLIFEGDVVKWVNSHDDEQIDIVKWLSGGLCLRNSSNIVGNYVYSDFEIIGNVHDNPELLEVTA